MLFMPELVTWVQSRVNVFENFILLDPGFVKKIILLSSAVVLHHNSRPYESVLLKHGWH